MRNTLMWTQDIAMHYNDVIMGTRASQITNITIVYSTVYSGADQSKTSNLRVTGLCAGNSSVIGEFPAQMTSDAENASIWWRHHGEIQWTNIEAQETLTTENDAIHSAWKRYSLKRLLDSGVEIFIPTLIGCIWWVLIQRAHFELGELS